MNPLILLVPIFLPLAGGAFLLVWPRLEERSRRIYLETVACLASAFVWFLLLGGGSREVVTVYRFAGPFSVDFRIDGAAGLFAGMVSVMWPLVLLYAFSYMEQERRKNAFFAFFLMTYGITLGVAFSANLLTLYVFFEMLTLVTIPLVSHYQDHESMYAARSYAAYLLGGGALAFIAVVLASMNGKEGVFVFGGSLSASAWSPILLQGIYVLAFFGFGVKAAVFPLYAWLPRAGVAPTPVTALLHAVAVVNSGVFAVMRLTYYSFGTDLLAGTWAQNLTVLLSAFTLLYAAVLAVKERHFKKRLAYSTVSNLSYMLFGLSLMTPAGFTAGLAHMLFHGIVKMSLFLCAGAFMHLTGKEYVYEVNGAGRRLPWIFTLYTLSALSLVGIPLFCGFVSKWKLFQAGAEAGTTPALIGMWCLIISAFLCAVYTLTVSVRAFFPPEGKDSFADMPKGKRIAEPWRMLLPIAVSFAANIAFGLYPEPILGFLEKVAAGLL